MSNRWKNASWGEMKKLELAMHELLEDLSVRKRLGANIQLLITLRDGSIRSFSQIIGCDPSTLSRIIAAKGALPSYLLLCALADALAVTLPTLLDEDLSIEFQKIVDVLNNKETL